MRGIQIDTRQQSGKHDHKHDKWASEGVPTFISKVPFGDYVLAPPASVDTKKDIYELYGNLTLEHERFKREVILARDMGCQLVVLVENEDGVEKLSDLATWSEPMDHYKMRKRKSKNQNAQRWHGQRIAKACKTMHDRYGVIFDFCHPSESCERIQRILYYYEGVKDDGKPEGSRNPVREDGLGGSPAGSREQGTGNQARVQGRED